MANPSHNRRWIRLLFGREMSLDHTLALWDQMFVKDFSMDCIDLVCVVIILHDRWERKPHSGMRSDIGTNADAYIARQSLTRITIPRLDVSWVRPK